MAVARPAIVPNNFHWPDELTDSQTNQPPAQAGRAQSAIEIAAQAVLDAHAPFPDSSLADLYDPMTMPPALLKAYQKLDTAVDKAHRLCGGKKSYAPDAEHVAFLFERHEFLTSLLPVTGGKKRRAPRRSSMPGAVAAGST